MLPVTRPSPTPTDTAACVATRPNSHIEPDSTTDVR